MKNDVKSILFIALMLLGSIHLVAQDLNSELQNEKANIFSDIDKKTSFGKIKIDMMKKFLSSSKMMNQESNVGTEKGTMLFSSVFESLGSEAIETGAMAIAPDDSIIIGGSTSSQNLKMENAFDPIYNGGSTDAILLQYLSDGKLLKSTYFGGNGDDKITNIALDSELNIIIAGITSSNDLSVELDSFDPLFNGNDDIFVAKFSYDGNLLWSTYLGGSHQDIVRDLVIDDNNGNILLTGYTESSNFPDTENSSAMGFKDGFLTVFDSQGNLTFSTYIGGSGIDLSSSLVLFNDSIIVTGETSSTDFNFVTNLSYIINNDSDLFLIGFDYLGSETDINVIFGGNGTDIPSKIVTDEQNGFFYVGGTSSSGDLSSNSAPDGLNGFISKFTSQGTIVWTKYLGGDLDDEISDIAILSSNIISVVGRTKSASFPISNAYDESFNGNFDGFFATLDSQGSLTSSTFLGGSQDDAILNIGYDSLENVIVSGNTGGFGFPQTTTNSYLNTSDVFVSKFAHTKDPFIINSFGGFCVGTSCESEFSLPWDIVIGLDNNLYITDIFNNRIVITTQSGQFINSWDGFTNPLGITQLLDGRFYISELNSGDIEVVNSDGTPNKTISLGFPVFDLTTNNTHLFAPDNSNNRIIIYNPEGVQVDTIGSDGEGNGQFKGIYSVAYNNGFIYASDIVLNRIQVFSADGNYINGWGQPGSSLGEFNQPRQVTVINNSLYVADYFNNRIQVFTLDGEFVTMWSGSTTASDKFRYPVGITANSSGFIYVNDLFNNKILSFKPITVQNVLSVGFDYISRYDYIDEAYYIGSSSSGFDLTKNYTNYQNKFLYYLDDSSQKIKKMGLKLDQWYFNKYGKEIYYVYLNNTFGASGSGDGQFLQSEDIALNSTNAYYITDSKNNRTSIFDSGDNFIKNFGLTGSEDGNFSSPKGIAISNYNGFIYIVDSGNNRIQYFDWNGTFIGKFGSTVFTDPFDIAINSKTGNIYVTDKGDNKIHVFDSAGSFKFSFGGFGSLAGELNNPGQLVVDSRSLVHVMDISNNRLQTFDENGNYKTFENKRNNEVLFSSLNGIAKDDDDNLYFNWRSYYILKFEKMETSITKSAKPYNTFSYSQSILATAFDPYGKIISAGTLDNKIVKFDITNSSILGIPATAHNNPVLSLDYTADGQILASAGADNTIKLWYANGQNTTILKGHNGQITDIEFFNNDLFLASSSGDRTIKIWNVSSGELIKTLRNHTQGVLDLSISPDGTILVSGSVDDTIKVWNISSGLVITTLTSHSDDVTGVEFSPDGKYFASVSYDRRVMLWDSTEYSKIQEMLLHTSRITSISFNPDSKEFATGDENGKIYVWDVNTKKASWFLEGHTGKIWDLTYSPDGTFLISGSADKSIKLWNIPSGVDNDLDRDGMDDQWETLYGLSPFDFDDKFQDADNDGIINSIEHLLGSNPLSNDSDSDSFSDILEFTSGLNPIYNDNLEDLDGDGISNIYEYRYGLDFTNSFDGNQDLDNDSLSNLQEFIFGSYANLADSDSDKIPDDIEFRFGLIPTIDDSNDDLDNDGMPNLFEYIYGLDISTNDSLDDFDLDGMPNIFEYIYDFDPSNPADASLDADFDGFTNLEEFVQGTDPRDENDPPKPQESESSSTIIPYNLLNDPTILAVVTIGGISVGLMGSGIYVYRKKFKEEF